LTFNRKNSIIKENLYKEGITMRIIPTSMKSAVSKVIAKVKGNQPPKEEVIEDKMVDGSNQLDNGVTSLRDAASKIRKSMAPDTQPAITTQKKSKKP
jgi:hypothetical protein